MKEFNIDSISGKLSKWVGEYNNLRNDITDYSLNNYRFTESRNTEWTIAAFIMNKLEKHYKDYDNSSMVISELSIKMDNDDKPNIDELKVWELQKHLENKIGKTQFRVDGLIVQENKDNFIEFKVDKKYSKIKLAIDYVKFLKYTHNNKSRNSLFWYILFTKKNGLMHFKEQEYLFANKSSDIPLKDSISLLMINNDNFNEKLMLKDYNPKNLLKCSDNIKFLETNSTDIDQEITNYDENKIYQSYKGIGNNVMTAKVFIKFYDDIIEIYNQIKNNDIFYQNIDVEKTNKLESRIKLGAKMTQESAKANTIEIKQLINSLYSKEQIKSESFTKTIVSNKSISILVFITIFVKRWIKSDDIQELNLIKYIENNFHGELKLRRDEYLKNDISQLKLIKFTLSSIDQLFHFFDMTYVKNDKDVVVYSDEYANFIFKKKAIKKLKFIERTLTQSKKSYIKWNDNIDEKCKVILDRVSGK